MLSSVFQKFVEVEFGVCFPNGGIRLSFLCGNAVQKALDVSETPSETEGRSSGHSLGASPGEGGHFQEQEQLKKGREPLSSLGCPRGSGIVAPKCQISDHDSKPLIPSPPHASAGICSRTLAGGGGAGSIFCLAWLWPPSLPVYTITLSSSVTKR